MLSVWRAVPVMMVTSLAEMHVFPYRSAAAFTITATTELEKCFIPMGNVRRSAIAKKEER